MTELVLSTQDLDDAFPGLVRELTAHCYKMTGSYTDAQDLVQETYVRARRGIGGFAGRSSLRTWLYRLATNTCLTALHSRRRRVLPSGLGAPSDDPTAPLREDPDIAWLQPLPTPSTSDPAETIVTRDSVRIALVAALQYLAPRQRAALLLREVLDWPASEIAEALGITEAAVKSLLQRGRRRLQDLDVRLDDIDPVVGDAQRDLLARYVAAFETSDADAIAEVIADDFSIEATPCRTWFSGMAVCLPFFRRQAFETSDCWRLLPTSFNGQPALALYRRESPREGIAAFAAVGVSVLTMRGGRITHAHDFIDASWVVAVGLPRHVAAS